ncbi:MAG: DsbA family protein [Candidatus Omnitrophica bacterium]|nr:DsbA family protein [Candidatus Omnitrophota bacterium]
MIFNYFSHLRKQFWMFLFFLLLFSLNVCALGRASQPSEDLIFQVRLKGGPSLGNPHAAVTLVEFTDFECPFCALVQPTLNEILKRYPNDVRLVFKNFPLSMHRNAKRAHLAALCAEEQGKFWEYRNYLFQNQKHLASEDLIRYADELGLSQKSFEACLSQEKYASKIQDDLKEALAIGVQGTPAFLINGRLLSGAQPYSGFEKMIEEELELNRKPS